MRVRNTSRKLNERRIELIVPFELDWSISMSNCWLQIHLFHWTTFHWQIRSLSTSIEYLNGIHFLLMKWEWKRWSRFCVDNVDGFVEKQSHWFLRYKKYIFCKCSEYLLRLLQLFEVHWICVFCRLRWRVFICVNYVDVPSCRRSNFSYVGGSEDFRRCLVKHGRLFEMSWIDAIRWLLLLISRMILNWTL